MIRMFSRLVLLVSNPNPQLASGGSILLTLLPSSILLRFFQIQPIILFLHYSFLYRVLIPIFLPVSLLVESNALHPVRQRSRLSVLWCMWSGWEFLIPFSISIHGIRVSFLLLSCPLAGRPRTWMAVSSVWSKCGRSLVSNVQPIWDTHGPNFGYNNCQKSAKLAGLCYECWLQLTTKMNGLLVSGLPPRITDRVHY